MIPCLASYRCYKQHYTKRLLTAGIAYMRNIAYERCRAGALAGISELYSSRRTLTIFIAALGGATKSFLWCEPTLLLRLLLTVAAAACAPLMVRASAVETASRHRLTATKKDELRAKAIVSLLLG